MVDLVCGTVIELVRPPGRAVLMAVGILDMDGLHPYAVERVA
jgi:hypothetical protein